MQSGYHAVWWQVDDADGHFLGSGPIDVVGDARSIKPGQRGPVAVHPMDPSLWRDVVAGAVLHLRERPHRTLGVATVTARVGVPDDAPLRFDAMRLRPGEVLLTRRTRPRAADVVVRWVARRSRH